LKAAAGEAWQVMVKVAEWRAGRYLRLTSVGALLQRGIVPL